MLSDGIQRSSACVHITAASRGCVCDGVPHQKVSEWFCFDGRLLLQGNTVPRTPVSRAGRSLLAGNLQLLWLVPYRTLSVSAHLSAGSGLCKIQRISQPGEPSAPLPLGRAVPWAEQTRLEEEDEDQKVGYL